jgi:hypothetical protein
MQTCSMLPQGILKAHRSPKLLGHADIKLTWMCVGPASIGQISAPSRVTAQPKIHPALQARALSTAHFQVGDDFAGHNLCFVPLG